MQVEFVQDQEVISMEERTEGAAFLQRFVESLRQHTEVWHARPDAESKPQFVLDDGTGDVELQFVPLADHIEATLTHRSVEKATQRFPLEMEPRRALQHFEVWLAEELTRLRTNVADRRPRQGRTRFMVTLEHHQLDLLRSLAEQQGVPVTELVRVAVDQYLATK